MTMEAETPAAVGAADGGLGNRIHNPKHKPSAPDCQAPSAAVDLPALRERLVGARRRLLERIALEYDPERTYPDTAWTRMVADIHITILAVDDMMASAIAPPNRRTKP